ncbi:MAG: penicillin-binding protein 1C [Desulfomonilaceae bacterium]|jgi:penicillin-binding protein 1C
MSHLSKRNVVVIFVAVFGVSIMIWSGLVYWEGPDFRASFENEKNKPARFVTDRNGEILRFLPDHNGCFNIWRSVDNVPEVMVESIVSAEDKRFFHHPGFDPIAIGRAAYTNLKYGRTISGASTISQQTVRLLNPRPRTFYSKIIEFLESVKLERSLSKREILELYLNLVPMGGRLKGIAIASLIYFHKDLSLINANESVCLAVIPRAPTRLDPNNMTGRESLIARAETLTRNMPHTGMIAPESGPKTHSPFKVQFYHRYFPNDAPHFVDLILAGAPFRDPEIRTTLDLNIQKAVEKILESHSDRLRRLGISQAAIMIAGTEDREVLAMIGSRKYSEDQLGYNNGSICFRSAGSTLKPFLYALALSKGYADGSEIPDTFRSYKTEQGDYMPFNANKVSYGPVSLRSALGNSLNVPAIKMAEAVSLEEFSSILKRLGLISGSRGALENYGLGLSVGAFEIRLYDLVQAYACLASGGLFQSLRTIPNEKGQSEQIFSDAVSDQITDILSDPLARILTFGNPTYFEYGFPVALKTGTSSKYRDNWAVAYTTKSVIGIWAGNFDGSPTKDSLGASSCGPLLKDIVDAMGSIAPAYLRNKRSAQAMRSLDSGGVENKVGDLGLDKKRAYQETDEDHVYLGPAYARWVYKREKEIGLSRFKLQKPATKFDSNILAGKTPGTGMNAAAGWDRETAIEIISPHEGDRLVCSGNSASTIPFRALPRVVVEYVVWLVDGKEVGRTPPPYEFFWTPSRGRHAIHAVIPSQDAASISIEVE